MVLTMCSFCSVKCCFLFFNILFMASGVALIIIGAQQYSTYTLMGAFAGSSLPKIAILSIALGATIALISILGFLGVFFNNSSMVSCFIFILIIILLLEILTGALLYAFRRRTLILKVKSAIDYESKARRVIKEYSPEKRHAIDSIQEKWTVEPYKADTTSSDTPKSDSSSTVLSKTPSASFRLRCCGADGPTDWSSSVGWENHDVVPDSCCVVKSQGCGQDKEKARTKGCIQAMRRFLLKNLVWVGAVCITLGITEVFGVLVGVCFCLNMKQKSYETMG